jgi:Mce-associated membrane protein
MTTLSENAESTVVADEEPAVSAEDRTDQEESEAAEVDEPSADDSDSQPKSKRERRPIAWSRVFGYGVLPGLALVLALAAGYLKWVDGSSTDTELARTESVRAASEDTVALLSYKADSVDKDLGAARERLTGEFKDAYTEMTRQVVIPGAKEKHISAVAKVKAAASVSATANHAVVLLFVDQTVTIGDGAPTDTQPVVRTTLDKVNGRWLVSRFDPV